LRPFSEANGIGESGCEDMLCDPNAGITKQGQTSLGSEDGGTAGYSPPIDARAKRAAVVETMCPVSCASSYPRLPRVTTS
jgi:hypothetical protein